MSQKYRIYINDNTLLISNQAPEGVEKNQQFENELFDFFKFYESLKGKGAQHYFLLANEPKKAFKSIRKKLTLIKAAGGLVNNAKGEYLFIYRNNKWDLPKGKVEKGEKMKKAAVREVEEECGVKVDELKAKICKTFHVYEMGGKLVLKHTNWYRMTVKNSPVLIPQIEEGITEASWVPQTKLQDKMKNTYPLIIDVLRENNML